MCITYVSAVVAVFVVIVIILFSFLSLLFENGEILYYFIKIDVSVS